MASPAQSPLGVERHLKRDITLLQALGVSFQSVVGAGVVALTGISIGLTGGGTPLAYALATVAVIVYSLPIVALGSAMPLVGGRYSYAARLLSPSTGFATMWLSILVTIQLSLLALAAANSVHALLPSVPVAPMALAVMTIFFLANLFGATFSNRLGIGLSVVMLAAFLLYGFVGVPQVHWEVLADVAPNGIENFVAAAALLTFAATGGSYVAEIGHEMKRPGRDIPLAVIGGTAMAGLLYVFMAIVSTGVLPVSEVAGKPMSVVAQHLLPSGGFAFFVLGGAVVAVVGALNALLLTATKPVLAAVGDGWLPKRLGAVNQRFGTPHWLLFLLYVIGVLPVLFGLSLEGIAKASSIAAGPMLAIIIIASYRLRGRYPDLHAAAPFKLGARTHLVIAVLGTGVLAAQTYLLVTKVTTSIAVALVVWLALGLGLWLARRRHVAAVLRARHAQPATMEGAL
ncbi:APC family permease [Amycolatopsis palatopharyngis]|uniref:APC family permease n=1 Tax=Amycolatopsis palatopharyngis TaxID=187982 RepID=UPI000E258C45|nr:APC family permease [Amycolatopsis palatopharyngis]